MKTAIVCVAIAALAGCASIPQTPAEIDAAAQAQLTATCPTAQAEVTTLQSLNASLPADINSAVDDAAPIIATFCAPGFAVSSANMATFLPAVTVIAVQYAATHK
jgi:hypothetical protein